MLRNLLYSRKRGLIKDSQIKGLQASCNSETNQHLCKNKIDDDGMEVPVNNMYVVFN